ncbi:MAG: hypothetical protein CL758_03150 [Chloroflexi bacterium]|nr:hypothetical protein [Chloroflexota bacterium]|tara:strand:- start:103 stop:618 length:516 start_codon:yes stop_codon:yes gene_type:complete
MSESINKLTNLRSFQPFSEGKPGNRTFYILAEGNEGKATIRLEKEQLVQLSLIIQELSANDKDLSNDILEKDLKNNEKFILDIKLIRLEVKKDPLSKLFVFDIYDSASKNTPTLQIYTSSEKIKIFASDALKVCAAGRPLCPLCGEAINPEGHNCPRTNGHINKEDLQFET